MRYNEIKIISKWGKSGKVKDTEYKMKSSLHKVARRDSRIDFFFSIGQYSEGSTFTLPLGHVLKMPSKSMLKENTIILPSPEKNFPQEHHRPCEKHIMLSAFYTKSHRFHRTC